MRDEAKFDRLRAFGRALPRLRARIEADLARPGLKREKVLAAAARLLELTLVRVGNREYERANKSFGLTTLRKRHVSLNGGGAVFEFRGKSGVPHRTGFHDRRLARVLRGCEALPGQRLFQFVDDDRRAPSASTATTSTPTSARPWASEFTAKDFRTWAGSLAGGRRALANAPAAASETEAKREIAAAVKAVAGLLGNTAAVCRACYIHPAVLEAYRVRRPA